MGKYKGRVFIPDKKEIQYEIFTGKTGAYFYYTSLIIIGGADKDSKLVVGPEQGRMKTIVLMEHILDDVHEVAGAGTIFPDDEGNPTLHMHMACGRKIFTTTGCIRNGVKMCFIRLLIPWIR